MKLLSALLALSFSFSATAQAQIENITSSKEKQMYQMMAFEAVADGGPKCVWIRRTSNQLIEIHPHELANLLQVTDVKTVTRETLGETVKLKMVLKANKRDMKKKDTKLPMTEIILEVEAHGSVATPTRMLFDVVAIEEGYVTDRFIECK